MKASLSSKRDDEAASNWLSLPNSPLRNSAVFSYEEQSFVPPGAWCSIKTLEPINFWINSPEVLLTQLPLANFPWFPRFIVQFIS